MSKVLDMKQLRIMKQFTLHIWLTQVCFLTANSGDQLVHAKQVNSRTSMSSVWSNNFTIYGPYLAIDGKYPDATGSVGRCRCCSVTMGSEAPWWRIDFGKQLLIGGVNITGQPGNGARHSKNISVYISDTDTSPYGDSHNDELVWHVPGTISGSFFTHSFVQPRLFQYMTITRPDATTYPDTVLVMCEVDFIGTDIYFLVNYTTPPECVPGRFGDRCSHRCHCSDRRPCHPVTGQCQKPSCLYGWIGDACDSPCPPNTYTLTCVPCGHCKDELPCDIITGRCTDGCDGSYTGELCTNHLPSDASTNVKFTIGVSVGAAGVLLIVVTSMTIFRFYRRRNSNQRCPFRGPSSTDYEKPQPSRETEQHVYDVLNLGRSGESRRTSVYYENTFTRDEESM